MKVCIFFGRLLYGFGVFRQIGLLWVVLKHLSEFSLVSKIVLALFGPGCQVRRRLS